MVSISSDAALKNVRNYDLYALDQLLKTDHDEAIRSLVFVSRAHCYRAGSPVPNTPSPIYDLTERMTGRIVPAGAGAMVITGHGVDFSGVDRAGNYIEVPAEVLADIAAHGGRFAIWAYFKLPSLADDIGANYIRGIISAADTQGGYGNAADAELAYAGFVNYGAPFIAIGRQTGVGTHENDNLPTVNADWGSIVQIGLIYDASGFYGTIRSVANGLRQTAKKTSFTPNTKDYSGKTLKFGITPFGWSVPLAEIIDEDDASNMQYLGHGVASLGRGNPNPLDILDRCWNLRAAAGLLD